MERIQLIIPKNFIPKPVTAKYFCIDEDGNELFSVVSNFGGDLLQEEVTSSENLSHNSKQVVKSKKKVVATLEDDPKKNVSSSKHRLLLAKEQRRKQDEKNRQLKLYRGKFQIRKKRITPLSEWQPELKPVLESDDGFDEPIEFTSVDHYKSKSPNIEDMPLEVLEIIIPYISGLDAWNLSKSSDLLGPRVFEAVKVTKRWSYWKDACYNCLPTPLFLTVLSSYNNILNRTVRLSYASISPSNPNVSMIDGLQEFDWEHVFHNAMNVGSHIECNPIKIEEKKLQDFEKKLKDEMILSYGETAANQFVLKHDRPVRITSTCGPILYNVLSHFKPTSKERNNMILVENDHLNNFSVRRTIRTSSAEIRCVKTIFLKQHDHENKLSEAVRILCCVSLDRIFLVPANEGGATTITPTNKNERPYKDMDPIIAIHGDVLCIWCICTWLGFFRLSINKLSNNLVATLITRFISPGYAAFWDQVAVYRPYYIPTLDEIVVENKETEYKLSMVSYCFGVTQVYSFMDEDEPDSSLIRVPIVKNFPVTHVSSERQMAARNELYKCKTGSQGHGILIFWNDNALGISWDRYTWSYAYWSDVLNRDSEDVSHVFVFSPNLLAVVADGDIYFLDVRTKKIIKDLIVLDDFNLLRHLALNLSPKNVFISDISFDFDRGLPYIFLVLEKKLDEKAKEESKGLTFMFKRISF